MRQLAYRVFAAVLGVSFCAWAEEPSTPPTSEIEFFEKRVRPVLVERCVKCHGPQEQEGSLRLDRPSLILKGGDLGPAIEPGDPTSSRLIQGIAYTDENFQMPPDGKLADHEIADIVEWVRMGAKVPADTEPVEATDAVPFDLQERGRHWCYQPVRVPSIPALEGDDWSNTPADRFLLARMREAGLAPAAEASRETQLRRLTFGLVGLPAEPDEVESFLTARRPDALERVSDRLLASPRYGERWGRHWLDVVRFSETLGHEFDYEIPNAWRYRDYVIDALNQDVPYDTFVREHIAGDSLDRRSKVEGRWESIVGTAFFWFGDATHSPVDVRLSECDRIDNQIDVMTKAFLAQTVACARCHDHKFDAIGTRDYYALAGILKSSRYEQRQVDPPSVRRDLIEKLRNLVSQPLEDEKSRDWIASIWNQRSAEIAERMLASATSETASDPLRTALAVRPPPDASHPMYAWWKLTNEPASEGESFLALVERLREDVRKAEAASREARQSCVVLHSREQVKASEVAWSLSGDAFHDEEISKLPTLKLGDRGARAVSGIVSRNVLDSGRLSKRLEGAARSATFEISKRYLHIRFAGRGSRANIVVNGFQLIRDPIYGPLTFALESDQPVWRTVDLKKWLGQLCYVEFLDVVTPNLTQGSPTDELREDYFSIEEVVLSDTHAPPPPVPCGIARVLLDGFPAKSDGSGQSDEFLMGEVESLVQLANRYASLAQQMVARWSRCGSLLDLDREWSDDEVDYWNWLVSTGVLDGATDWAETASLETQVETWKGVRGRIEGAMLPVNRTPAISDGSAMDECVLVRGNHRTPGEVVSRRFLEVLDGPEAMSISSGSGRLELADRIVDGDNPLTARVMVNRLWKHHFGEGIVRSVDDFGRMGEPPTHPELLDWLASEFVTQGWRLKAMHRLMVHSAAYRMSSLGNRESEERDGRNDLLSHFRRRRLEGEAIRDSMLRLSGRLDAAMGGPGELPHLTEFSPAIGRPPRSGSLDGGGRRSVYLNVRRNFLPPFLLAFDYPLPQTTIGRRNSSNVPSQALAMLNDPFVVGQAALWAERLLRDGPTARRDRVRWLYLSCYGRPAIDREMDEALQFVDSMDDPQLVRRWAELCHALWNAKEFIYLE